METLELIEMRVIAKMNAEVCTCWFWQELTAVSCGSDPRCLRELRFEAVFLRLSNLSLVLAMMYFLSAELMYGSAETPCWTNSAVERRWNCARRTPSAFFHLCFGSYSLMTSGACVSDVLLAA